ncbi:hypothetical protein BDM02DRAFT_2091673 [Thelephora ganbajun]|uniref:Uncharacterized protein n=1 Tax=Thelephora ganbajun TaxID=370292 RepID=A0ACB6YYE7_THEGA|nr:hypothetical protein BDM02DRAFT_2091673 [Thelephora ganbajun]
MTAAYMRILIHTMNNSLFPDADPNSIAWTGPPANIVTVQSLLYASLMASLFAAFLAMLGKQRVSRYLLNQGGSAVDKSRDRQRKLDGLKEWGFYLAIESLPVVLQLALLLLGGALSLYLWTISRTVAGVIIAITLFVVTLYIFLTLAATFYHNCPYQTPLSIVFRAIIGYLGYTDAALTRWAWYLIRLLPSTRNLGRILRNLRRGIRSVVVRLCCIPTVVEEAEHIPLASVVASPSRIFEDVSIDREACKADTRCIFWVLDSMTDINIISSTVRFAADMMWYPEIAGALSPDVLAGLFLDCSLDGQVIPGKSEHASSIGMGLASVLSIQLSMAPEDEGLKDLCERIDSNIQWTHPSEPMFVLVRGTLRIITETPHRRPDPLLYWGSLTTMPDNLPTTHKLWLSRILLQTLWRWRRLQGPTTFINSYPMYLIFERFMADGDQNLTILKTNCYLIMAISLGLQIDIRDLYAPNNECVVPRFSYGVCSSSDSPALQTAIELFHQRLQMTIGEAKPDKVALDWTLSVLVHLDPFQTVGTRNLAFLWITGVLNSEYPEDERYKMASQVVQLLGKRFDSNVPGDVLYVEPAWIPPLLSFLSLSERFYTTDDPPYPGSIALLFLSTSAIYGDFDTTFLPVFASILLPTHPLQSRSLALKVFYAFIPGWFSSQMESVLYKDLNKLVQAVGDPFQFTPDLPLQDGKPVGTVGRESMTAMVILTEFASLDLWRNHLNRSNFASYEQIVSTEEGRTTAFEWMLHTATFSWQEFLCTPTKIAMAIRRLEELQCLNTAEVVILWAWTIGVIDPVDRNGWRLIGDETLRFYQTHGTARLTALKRHILDADEITERDHLEFLQQKRGYERPCRMKSIQTDTGSDRIDLSVSRVCQLRRLYHLLGYDPMTRPSHGLGV